MKIIECPRDAMQGITEFIPTETKIHYLNTLLKVGFDTLDFGSFVSPKAIPQMRDTEEVLAQLDLKENGSKYQKKVYMLPKKLDEEVARLHLEHLGVKLTKLTTEQASYIGVPVEGPYKASHYRY